MLCLNGARGHRCVAGFPGTLRAVENSSVQLLFWASPILCFRADSQEEAISGGRMAPTARTGTPTFTDTHGDVKFYRFSCFANMEYQHFKVSLAHCFNLHFTC